MHKFVIVEPRLTGKGEIGHYLGNDKKLFQVAKQEGWRTTLVTSAQFELSEVEGTDVIPIYTYIPHEGQSEGIKTKVQTMLLRHEKLYKKTKAIAGDLKHLLGKDVIHYQPNEQFYQDTCTLFEKISLKQGDVVYYGDCYMDEVGAAARAYKERFGMEGPCVEFCVWDIVLKDPDADLEKEQAMVEYIRACLADAVDLIEKGLFRFYSDSRIRNEQFDRAIGMKAFRLMPMLSVCKTPEKVESKEFVVSALGAPRYFKGFHHLPQIVEQAFKGKHPDRLLFQIQTCLSSSEYFYGILQEAKKMLEQYGSEQVRAFPKPLSDKEYAKAVAETKIMLLPYERSLYYAYTSGPFSEAIFQGIPVIIPDHTWMSDTIADRNREYLLKEISDKGIALFEGHLSQQKKECFVDVSGYSKVIIKYEATVCESNHCCKFGADYLDESGKKLQNRTITIEGRENAAFKAVRVPGKCKNIRLKAKEKSAGTISVYGIKASSPLGVIGGVYTEITEVADLITEIHDYYEHYKESVEAFSVEWAKIHGPDQAFHALTVEQ